MKKTPRPLNRKGGRGEADEAVLTGLAEGFLHHLDAPETASDQHGDGEGRTDVRGSFRAQFGDRVNAWISGGLGHCVTSGDQGQRGNAGSFQSCFFHCCIHDFLFQEIGVNKIQECQRLEVRKFIQRIQMLFARSGLKNRQRTQCRKRLSKLQWQ